jgi:hypothetical protein
LVEKPSQVLFLIPSALDKKPERKRKNLFRLGIDQDHAYTWKDSAKNFHRKFLAEGQAVGEEEKGYDPAHRIIARF